MWNSSFENKGIYYKAQPKFKKNVNLTVVCNSKLCARRGGRQKT
jgi:hypothetical protein